MLRTQDFSVAVGGALTLPIRAAYVKYLDGTAGGLSTPPGVRTGLGGGARRTGGRRLGALCDPGALADAAFLRDRVDLSG